MAFMKIKTKISKLQTKIRALTEQITKLQSECDHPRYEKGLSIIACVQEVWLCTECGYAKPIQHDWFSDNPNG